ncbi:MULTISPECIES: hypothetical protein [Enterobacterales]|uniref:hypothetical protein n=1 Tax=Enterobacterales TaxID=91347 RepID=UPI0013E01CBA|nr:MULTISPECIES: hypothetical protein [Enterobacterales]ELI8901800.1 hypothetical protein [Proteus mirabilis]MBI6221970.1 hypothetical protein [Proteus mirabilis]MBI6224949.1 hypothetical protein [Proteus mirabilis]MBI6347227.1 hypothetical protein [Proteus mirabilis]MBM7213270.1 hypothetical protein [Morganella morganii]
MATFLFWITIVGAFTGLIGTFIVFFTSNKSDIGKDLGLIGASLTGLGVISLLWMRAFN